MKIKIYKIIETDVIDCNVNVTVKVFLHQNKAQKEFEKRMAVIEADAEGVFDEFGNDSQSGVGVRESYKETSTSGNTGTYFGIHHSAEASLWDCSVIMEKDYLR